MSKTIPGVPESITRAAYVELIERLGIEPSDAISLRLSADAIYVELARGPGGDIVPGRHSIHIPVKG